MHANKQAASRLGQCNSTTWSSKQSAYCILIKDDIMSIPQVRLLGKRLLHACSTYGHIIPIHCHTPGHPIKSRLSDTTKAKTPAPRPRRLLVMTISQTENILRHRTFVFAKGDTSLVVKDAAVRMQSVAQPRALRRSILILLVISDEPFPTDRDNYIVL